MGLSVKVISMQAMGSNRENKTAMRFFMEEVCFIICIIQSKLTSFKSSSSRKVQSLTNRGKTTGKENVYNMSTF